MTGTNGMEIAIELQIAVRNHLAPISFEAIVDIVQMHTRQFAHHTVENTRWKGLRDGVEARIFPAGDQIVALIQLGEKVGNLCGIILQVPVHGKDNLAATTAETGHEGGRLAKVAAEADHPHKAGMLVMQLLDFRKGFVGTAIIHKDDFITVA